MHVNKNVVRGLIAVSGLACVAATASAQAPASAQVWDVRFVIDGAGPGATQVGITMLARVGIRSNTATNGTNNFGVSNVGGGTTGTNPFGMTYVDPAGPGVAGPNNRQASVTRGATGEALNDNNGNPIAGLFNDFRSGLSPNVNESTNGDNGVFGVNAGGSPTAGGVVGGRSLAFTSLTGPTRGVAQLDANGAFVNSFDSEAAAIFRFSYTPRFDSGDGAGSSVRTIRVNLANVRARYIFRVNQNGGSFLGSASSSTFILPNSAFQQSDANGAFFTFQVPTPGAAALVGLGGLVAARRRRA